MGRVEIGSVIVAFIAALAAWASQRAASRASIVNTSTTSRVEAEKGAYERARDFDTETIRRQDVEIAELRAQVKTLVRRVDQLEREKENKRDRPSGRPSRDQTPPQ